MEVKDVGKKRKLQMGVKRKSKNVTVDWEEKE